MMLRTETSGDDAAEKWLTPVNWEEDHAVKAKWRRRKNGGIDTNFNQNNQLQQKLAHFEFLPLEGSI